MQIPFIPTRLQSLVFDTDLHRLLLLQQIERDMPQDHQICRAGWYNKSVALTFSGQDSLSGIATCTSTTYSGPDSATASVPGTCTDTAGNSTAGTFALKYDTTPPVTTATPSGTQRPDGVYTSDVTITLSVSDGTGSGVATTEYQLDTEPWTTYTNPLVITIDGSHTLLSRSTDRADNVEATKSLTFEVQHDGQDG